MMNSAYKDIDNKPQGTIVIGGKEGVRIVPKSETSTTSITHYRPAEVTQPITLDVSPTNTSHVVMQTSAVDKANAFLRVSVPLFAAFAFAITTLAIVTTGLTLVSAFVLYWLIFALTWLVGWIATLLISAEGSAFVESWRKWNVVSREQKERWRHYRNS